MGNNSTSYFETQPLYLAGQQLEAVGNPRLLNHQEIVFRHRKTSIEKEFFKKILLEFFFGNLPVVVREASLHPGGDGAVDLRRLGKVLHVLHLAVVRDLFGGKPDEVVPDSNSS